jgi:glycosyltransferase involved in cell wall biosynthesis
MLKTVVVVSDIAHVNGGAAEVAIKSAIGLAEMGLQVYFFSAAGPVDSRLIKSGVIVNCLNQTTISNPRQRILSGINALWNFRAEHQLRLLLNQLNKSETIIHIHSWYKALSASIFKAIHDAKFVYTVTLHDYSLVCPNAGLYDYRRRKNCELKPLSLSCVIKNCDSRSYLHKIWRLLRHYIQILFGKVPKKKITLVSVSSFSEKIYRPLLRRDIKLKYISNPIDCSKNIPADPSKSKNILYVGRMSIEKGVDILAEAARRIGCSVNFVGDGPMLEFLRVNYPSNQYYGWQQRVRVMQEISSARCIVLPSVWYETQGLVVLEAAALGVPAIVSDHCAARDLVVSEITGLHFKSGSVDSLQTELTKMMSGEFVKTLGNNAFNEYWKAPKDIFMHTKFLINFYSDLLEKASAT